MQMAMFYQCNNLRLVGLKVVDSPNNFITLMGGTQIELSNLDIQAPENSPNTDGIEIAGSTSVFVHDSHVASGDGCIAINNHARDGGDGFARNISFENITLSNVSNPILIDQYYCPNRSCSFGGAEKTAVKISEITYKQIIGTTTTDAAIFFNCSRVQPGCTNIDVDQVNITSIVPGRQTYARCVNAHGTQKQIFK
ncbi:hypothetical protein Cgig2_014567 [Carnegiea gigantea]|uniref:Polygalacturonase n=1 Tax=Carnegiea gigantea TaxID=171969 RepID=A0A9Q1QSS3_9CARY|nr:hypothetical protein Cgig2_014567 [Carnegiea gigantea]